MVTPEIPESTMNIHQVAVVLTEHSKKIAELEAIILKQNDIIIQLQVQQVQVQQQVQNQQQQPPQEQHRLVLEVNKRIH